MALKEIDRTGEIKNFSNRWNSRPRLWVLHTEEGNSDAQGLMNYFRNAEVSYHYTCDNFTCLAVVDTNYASWSVLDANPYCINFCFAGSKAGQSRETWINKFGEAIDTAAWLFVRDAKQYGFANIRTLSHQEVGRGLAGGTDHFGITKGIGIGTHTDVGMYFPWDVYQAAIVKYAFGAPAPAPQPILNAIAEMVKISPWLGIKETAEIELATPDGRGRYAFFDKGAVYWTEATGARAIPEYLLEGAGTYAELGYEAGPLGYPVASNTVLEDGEVQAFEKGVLYRKGHPGQDEHEAHFVTGMIGARWARQGFEKSRFGWPTSNEITQTDGSKLQYFENGQMLWSPDGVTALQVAGEADVLIPDQH